MNSKKQAFMVSAMKSGSGKTLITLGLINIFKRMGKTVSIYKTGPDYIDNSNLISDKFRAKYHKEVEDYIAENDIIDYVPIVGGQDPSENYELISYDQNTGMVVAKPVYPGFDGEAEEVKLIVKNINGKWIIDDYIQTYF
mgnify:CR=1 FL=1